MALTSFFLRVVTLTLLAACVHASPSVRLPYNIPADKPTVLNISYNLAADSELRDRYDAYRVYLAVEPPGWGLGPVCWLAYMEDIDTTNVTITIPGDVTPDKYRIKISTSLFQKGASRGNGYSYSGSTTLVGASGNWSQRELDGWEIADADVVSCDAFGCARECNERYYTGDKTRYSEDPSDKETDDCVNQCVKDLNPRARSSPSTTLAPSVLMVAATVGLVYMIL
ncbi:hypothetical protein FALBO_7620 [Fusarium albosuccineum]|uniref:Uncharacterized protein n=1 Tax=Fusarium albosuccineum TaxID=1237068 RepID=A0A8H4LAZ8_9HYPO|nr:hypothetical protein FALBO_7620 [Fusarium albosuccineum]